MSSPPGTGLRSNKDLRPTPGTTPKDRNRFLRQEDLRDRIRGSGLATSLLDNITKMQTLAEGDEAPCMKRLAALKATTDAQFKLLGKVMPDLKTVEIVDERVRASREQVAERITATLERLTGRLSVTAGDLARPRTDGADAGTEAVRTDDEREQSG